VFNEAAHDFFSFGGGALEPDTVSFDAVRMAISSPSSAS